MTAGGISGSCISGGVLIELCWEAAYITPAVLPSSASDDCMGQVTQGSNILLLSMTGDDCFRAAQSKRFRDMPPQSPLQSMSHGEWPAYCQCLLRAMNFSLKRLIDDCRKILSNIAIRKPFILR